VGKQLWVLYGLIKRSNIEKNNLYTETLVVKSIR